jgi:hypothetical protein
MKGCGCVGLVCGTKDIRPVSRSGDGQKQKPAPRDSCMTLILRGVLCCMQFEYKPRSDREGLYVIIRAAFPTLQQIMAGKTTHETLRTGRGRRRKMRMVMLIVLMITMKSVMITGMMVMDDKR